MNISLIQTKLYFVFLLVFGLSFSQSEKTFNATELSNIVGNTNTVSFNTPQLTEGLGVDVNPMASVSLIVDKADSPSDLWFVLELDVEVSPILGAGVVDSERSYTTTLRVESNTFPNVGGNFDHISTYNIAGYFGAEVKILRARIEDKVKERPLQDSRDLPPGIKMVIGFSAERFYRLDAAVAPEMLAPVYTEAQNTLEIKWKAVTGATYYDVEWTWLDNYGNDNDTSLAAEVINLTQKEFKQNNTRIQTTEKVYQIPLIFDKGYLVYRVRAVGRYLEDVTKKKYGIWSSGTDVKQKVSDWKPNVYEVLTGHKTDMNWQFQASYAEGGKRKDVVSYFDGTLRNRQTVTKINSDDNIIVGEVIYDGHGRPAIEVLPVPTTEKGIGFITDFNKNNLDEVYSYQDFDEDAHISNTAVEITPMSTNKGASQYYSNQNKVASAFKDRIPDAKGMPFSQIEYTADNTGRIHRKGGVGPDHQLGSKHEMRYYYSIPKQKELNRLFGYNVGNYSRYKKNAVVDPNGQISVSYIDPQGRTIATALAGGSPSQLDALDDETKNEILHERVTFDLLEREESNALFSTTKNGVLLDGKIHQSLQVNLADNTDYQFQYALETERINFEYGCEQDTSNFPFVYDIVLDVEDNTGGILLETPLKVTKTASTTPFSFEEDVKSMEEGPFGVSKILKVNKEKIEAYTDAYISKITNPDGLCYEDPNKFSPEAVISDCFISIETCRLSLRTKDDGTIFSESQLEEAKTYYVNKQMASYDAIADPSEIPLLEERFAREWVLLYASCDAAFQAGEQDSNIENSISCANGQTNLETDMSPSGQYGMRFKDQNETLLEDLSIFNEENLLLSASEKSWRNPFHYEKDLGEDAGHYYDENGFISYVEVQVDGGSYDPPILEQSPFLETDIEGLIKVEPQYLKLSDIKTLKTYWQESWAASLLIYHPEYAYLEYEQTVCARTSTVAGAAMNSDGYTNFLYSKTYTEAVSAGLDPFASATQLMDIDPYFEGNAHESLQKEVMREALTRNYDGFGATNGNGAMLTIAYNTVACNSLENCDRNRSFLDTKSIVQSNSFPEAQRERVWETYRSYYVNLKQKIQYVFSTIYAHNKGFYNSCINSKDKPIALVAILADYPQAKKIHSLLDRRGASLCTAAGNSFYADKEKRYPPADALYNSGQSTIDGVAELEKQTNYRYYVDTGVCPLARDLEFYLNGLVTQKNSNDTYNNIASAMGNYTGNYLTRALYDALEVTPNSGDFTITGTPDPSNSNILEVAFQGGTPVRLALPSNNSNYAWSGYGNTWVITRVNTLKYTNYVTDATTGINQFNFQVLARVTSPSNREGAFEEIILTGTTEAKIGECSINFSGNEIGDDLGSGGEGTLITNDCDIQPRFKAAMLNLLNALVQSNQIGASRFALKDYPAYRDSYLPEYFGIAPNTNVFWKVENGICFIETPLETYLTYSLDGNLPAGKDYIITGLYIGDIINNSEGIYNEGHLTYLNSDFKKIRLEGQILKTERTLLNFSCCGITDIGGPDVTCEMVDVCEANSDAERVFEEELLKIMDYAFSQNWLDAMRAGSTEYDVTDLAAVLLNDFQIKKRLQTQVNKGDSPLVVQTNYVEARIIEGEENAWFELVFAESSTSFAETYLFFDLSNVGDYKAINGVTCVDKTTEGYTISYSKNNGGLNTVAQDNLIVRTKGVSNNIEDVGCEFFELEPECDILAAINVDGSFETLSSRTFTNGQLKEQIDAAGFYNATGTVDAFFETTPQTPLIRAQQPSPDGGVFVGVNTNEARNNIESFGVNIPVEGGKTYVISFYQANGGDDAFYPPATPRTEPGELGTVTVTLDGVTVEAPTLAFNGFGAQTWSHAEVFITAPETKANAALLFGAKSETGRSVYMTIDAIEVVRTDNRDCFDDGLAFLAKSSVTDNTSSFATKSRNATSNATCVSCIPEPVAPVSCTDKYIALQQVVASIAGYELPAYYTVDYFCDAQLARAVDDYGRYISGLVTSVTDLQFLTIAEFAATTLNYSTAAAQNAVSGYIAEVTAKRENAMPWTAFVANFLKNNPEICQQSVLQTVPEIAIELPEQPTGCKEFVANVSELYNQDSYTRFLEAKRIEFKKAYIKAALDNVTEHLNMTYFDKEYQYTLYYYDQSGNLKQTVPPEGVYRFNKDELEGDGVHAAINAHRNANTPNEVEALLPAHTFLTNYKYNSLNQLTWQKTPDGGITRFAYDKLGRIIASQNARQLKDNTFSYTTYDGLGRIVEAGELVPNQALEILDASGKLVFASNKNEVFTGIRTKKEKENGFLDFPNNISDVRHEVTQTHYSERTVGLDVTSIFNTVTNKSTYASTSRNRVTGVYYFDSYTADTALINYDNALFYNYDIHGNVVELVQHNTMMRIDPNTPSSGIKNVRYEYDLISGNVNKIIYQKGQPDQFIHRYVYDADNRIVSVFTSSDGMNWEEDANYQYYPHGPLARTVLGDQEVQGIDYSYTLQGWLKGVNSETIVPTDDMGQDGAAGSSSAKDAFGYSLSYYDKDYSAIGTTNAFKISAGSPSARNLYNGNIKQMVTGLMDTKEEVLDAQSNHYTYDQLNRIVGMQGYGVSGVENYSSSYSYDNNGNLKTLNRTTVNSTGGTTPMDALAYTYKMVEDPETGLPKPTNQLDHVDDALGALGFNDLGKQTAGNYTYDAIGQLTRDAAEGLTIAWRVDGKVKSVTKDNGEVITFVYDGLGNRIAKTTKNGGEKTYYVRDAQGNTLAVYGEGEPFTVSSCLALLNIDSPTKASGVKKATEDILITTLVDTEQNLEVTAGKSVTYANGAHIKTGAIHQATIGVVTCNANDNQVVEGMRLKEQHIYGSSRLGLQQTDVLINEGAPVTEGTITYTHTVGDKRYELSNHLGNVLSVVSDRKLFKNDTFVPDVLSYNDYYPFGMLLPNRHGQSDFYRYGFNGKEKDDEVKGEGAQYDYGFRIYDPRLGKFLSTDPLFASYAYYTPYQFAGNKPIMALDLDGLEEYYHWDYNFNKVRKVQLNLVDLPMVAPDLSSQGLFQTAEQAHRIGAEFIRQNAADEARRSYKQSYDALQQHQMNQNPFYIMYKLSPVGAATDAYIDYKAGNYGWAAFGAVAGLLELKAVSKGLRSMFIKRFTLTDAPLKSFDNIISKIDADITIRNNRVKEISQFPNPAQKGKLTKLDEAETAADYELISGAKLMQQVTGGPGDFINSNNRKVIDVMGGARQAKTHPNYLRGFLPSIDIHINKLQKGVDKIILDMEGFSDLQKIEIEFYIREKFEPIRRSGQLEIINN